MKQNKYRLQKITYLVFLLCLAVGFAAGLFASGLASNKPASSQEIEEAKSQITELFKGKTVDACWRVNDGSNLAVQKYELTYRNLRINKFVNRAIISDCSDIDTLLAKNKSGEWIRTTVNLQLGNRVNPEWQKACLIEDITVPDDKVRPENSSIDEMNFQECEQLGQM